MAGVLKYAALCLAFRFETMYKKKHYIYKFLQSLGNLKTKVARDKTGFKLEKMVFRYSLNTEDCHGFSVFRV